METVISISAQLRKMENKKSYQDHMHDLAKAKEMIVGVCVISHLMEGNNC